MRTEVLTLTLIVGAFTWAFRYFPTRLDLSAIPQRGVLARFLASTGPAAIATLFVASILPMVQDAVPLPLIFGVLSVLVVFGVTKSVVGATLAGSAVYGAVFGF